MGETETTPIMTFPPTPFLLVEEDKECKRRYYIIEVLSGLTLDVLDDGSFIQTLTLKAHIATKAEIAEHPRWDKGGTIKRKK